MFCSNCGKEIIGNGKFCSNCGSPVISNTVSNAVPVVAENNPVVSNEVPVVVENSPVVSTDVPVVAENSPVVSTDVPVVAENSPVVSTEVPVVVENSPVVSTNVPPVVNNSPIVNNTSSTVGNTVPPFVPNPAPTVVTGKISCPSCGSLSLQATVETDVKTQSTGGGYSAGSGCLGYFIFGPLGLLCGSCGSGTKTSSTSTNRHFFVCNNCGTKFRNIHDELEEAKQKEKTLIRATILIPIFMAAMFALLITFLVLVEADGLLFGLSLLPLGLTAICCTISCIISKIRATKFRKSVEQRIKDLGL